MYGLQLVNAHMRRSLGTLTPWEIYRKATEAPEAVSPPLDPLAHLHISQQSQAHDDEHIDPHTKPQVDPHAKAHINPQANPNVV